MDLDQLLTALHGARDLLAARGREASCARCELQNPPSAMYCAGCGHRMRFPCPGCKALCNDGERHCRACGWALTDAVTQGALEDLAERDERRASDPLLLFRDLQRVGSRRSAKYRARRKQGGARRFLKEGTSKQARELLLNESRALAGLEHDNVIRLHETHEHAARVLLELEHIPSDELRFPLPIPTVIEIMRGVAGALAAVHARGWIHGDVKPGNILMRDGVTPVLIDFESAQEPGPSRFGAYTPMFAAPEQVFGDHIDARVDVYGFGVTLYLLFIYDRVPSLLDPETTAQQAMQQVLKAKVRRAANYLEEATIFGGVARKNSVGTPSWMAEVQAQQQQVRKPRLPGAASTEAEALGAKYFFSAELERLATVNRRLDLTRALLELVCDATEIEPDQRPPDGAALARRMDELARRAREEAPA
ncbi:MAG: protein kinase [Myxococcales bacterium]|nr:protein kinase [Myxococcales bacterium]